MVTGLIITPDHKVSIGRERKRLIRSMIDNFERGKLDDRAIMACKGMIGFVVSAEPTFLTTLRKAYGRELIKTIMRTPQIRFYEPINLLALLDE